MGFHSQWLWIYYFGNVQLQRLEHPEYRNQSGNRIFHKRRRDNAAVDNGERISSNKGFVQQIISSFFKLRCKKPPKNQLVFPLWGDAIRPAITGGTSLLRTPRCPASSADASQTKTRSLLPFTFIFICFSQVRFPRKKKPTLVHRSMKAAENKHKIPTTTKKTGTKVLNYWVGMTRAPDCDLHGSSVIVMPGDQIEEQLQKLFRWN